MSRKVHKTLAAIRDLEELFAYLIERNVSAAERFLYAAEAIFRELALSPNRGSNVAVTNPKLAGIRVLGVPSFENYLVFHRAVADGVEIVRVLHAARDWLATLEEGV
jgi:toxin ParE1/3/4